MIKQADEDNMNNNGKRRNKSQAQDKAVNAAKSFAPSSAKNTDPQGSYTGTNKNPSERPVQDADDL